MSQNSEAYIWGPMDGSYDVNDPDTGAYWSARPDPEQLEQAIRRLRKEIEKCMALGPDWDLRGEDEHRPILEGLRKAGCRLLAEFARGDHEAEIVNLLRNATLIRPRTGLHIPWEFLYFGKADGPVDVMEFLGAWAVVGRPFEAGVFSKAVNDNGLLNLTVWSHAPAQGETPFGLAEDRRLLSARTGAEREMFKRQNIEVNVLAPLKANSGGYDSLELWLASSPVLTHFNSHADDDASDEDGEPTSALFVSNEVPVNLDRIKRLVMCEQSIVFLNCCNAISLRFNKSRSLADAFAKRRVAAVVATTERIADGYATLWAEQFYVALSSGAPVGAAILQARQEMLKRDGNPMALLYAFLGKYEARIPQPAVTTCAV